MIVGKIPEENLTISNNDPKVNKTLKTYRDSFSDQGPLKYPEYTELKVCSFSELKLLEQRYRNKWIPGDVFDAWTNVNLGDYQLSGSPKLQMLWQDCDKVLAAAENNLYVSFKNEETGEQTYYQQMISATHDKPDKMIPFTKNGVKITDKGIRCYYSNIVKASSVSGPSFVGKAREIWKVKVQKAGKRSDYSQLNLLFPITTSADAVKLRMNLSSPCTLR